MARKLRVQYPGAIYHVMNRGDRRESIFKDDVDRERFLATLGEACAKTSWQVHAFCLMPNHFHLVVETPQSNLVAGMKWFLGTYTARFNRRHKLFGHLFSGRYKALIVDGSGNGYPWKTEYADGGASTNFYNTKGQLDKSVDPDGVTRLYSYNGLGQSDKTIVDMNRNGVGTDSVDRITRSTNDVVEYAGSAARRSPRRRSSSA